MSVVDSSRVRTEVPLVSVRGSSQRYPVRRVFCVGLNYMDHAKEMGRTVERAAPFYFTKNPFTIVPSGQTVPYPSETANFHHEVEMVVALGAPAFRIAAEKALDAVFGYAVGLDMTRRDLQLAARDKGRPWDLGKDVEASAVISEIVPASLSGHPHRAALTLTVNGERRQHSDVDQMIWTVAELLADLSKYYHLDVGDVIYTGTPHGVGPVASGDALVASLEGVAELTLRIGPAED